jgi:hypothetical protein
VIVQVSGETLLIFVGIPALVIAVVWLLVFAPSIAKGPRYRPGLSWWAPPVWVGGPSTADPAVARQLTTGTGTGTGQPTSGEPGPGTAKSTGGASASW